MVFIARPKAENYEYFARRNAPSPKHGGDRWYMVTGNVEPDETLEEAVVRETQEETGIDTFTKINKLPIVNTYPATDDTETEIIEQAFVLLTEYAGNIELNEESTEYLWLSLEDFVQKIWWPKDRSLLGETLHQALLNK